MNLTRLSHKSSEGASKYLVGYEERLSRASLGDGKRNVFNLQGELKLGRA